MHFTLIAAVDAKNGIGKGGTIPWRLPADLAFFHKTTMGKGNNAVVMGRATWESLPQKYRPLPGRLNIVLTHDKNYPLPKGVMLADGLPEAMNIAENAEADELFVIGGAKVFDFSIHNPACKRIFLTRLRQSFDCDTFFPAITSRFYQHSKTPMQHQNGIDFEIFEYRSE